MNIDEKLQKCLKRGYLNISVCYGVCNVLLMQDDEVLQRMRSGRGLGYTVRTLVGTVLQDSELLAQTELDFPLVMAPMQHCDYMRFLTNAYMTVCFVATQFRIKHHATGMNDHMDIPGSILRHASDKTYSEALKKILHATPTNKIECVY